MRELYDFKRVMNELKEDAPVINSNDFGATRNLSDVSTITGLSYLEDGMAGIIGDVCAHGESLDKAKKLVDAAIKELIQSKVIPELPTEEDSDGKKAMWLNMARPRIFAHLRMTGKIM